MCGYGDTEFNYETDKQEAVGCAVLEQEPEKEDEQFNKKGAMGEALCFFYSIISSGGFSGRGVNSSFGNLGKASSMNSLKVQPANVTDGF